MTRRDFIKTAAIFTAGLFLPNFAEAKPKLKTLDELDIKKIPLDFAGSLNYRTHTGAIVIHHSGMRDIDMSATYIHDLHVHKNRWAGIGYHFVVRKDGTIEQGRPLNAIGAHSAANNEFTVGICLTGNYNIGEPPKSQLNSAVRLVSAICDKYKFEPTDTTVFGHKDLCSTSCPGESLYKLLPSIIKRAEVLL